MHKTPISVFTAICSLLILVSGLYGQEKEIRIGLALSGGGAKGLAHIGVLKVLDEAGIPVHLISGTSMGAIVGAFYSLGYSPAEIETLVTLMDWQQVLTDQIRRRSLPMVEKYKYDRYLGSLELQKGMISLPTGIIKGQNVAMLLAKMTWRANGLSDFSKLPIPFVAVATDIASGKAIALKSGNLATVLRATMAIPSLLTPQVLQGKLLVDGGITRNLPAQDVKALGADYIIGVDVGTALRSVEELNTFIDIMDQSIRLGSYLQTIEQRQICDLVIAPDMSGLTFSDFSSSREFIRRGVLAARKMLPQITIYVENHKIAATVNAETRRRQLSKKTVFIDSVKISGAIQRPLQVVKDELDLSVPGDITAATMSAAMNRVYSSQAYHKVSYRIKEQGERHIAYIELQEKDAQVLRYGFHYNSRDAAKFLLNTTIRNLPGANSVFSVDLQLANRTQIDAEYYYTPEVARHLGFRLRAYHHSTIYDIYKNDNRVAQFGSQIQGLDLFIGSIYSTRLMSGFAYNLEFVAVEREIGAPVRRDSFSRIARLSYLLQFDTLDKTDFPRQGMLFTANTEFALNEIGSEEKFWRSSADLQTYMPLSKKLSLLMHLQAGFTTSNSLPLPQQFYLGGNGSFSGFKTHELAGTNLQAFSLGLRWQVLRDKFITARFDIGNTFPTWELSRDFGFYEQGFGLGIGAATPFGPLEITFETSKRHAILTHINIGYLF